MKRFYTFSILYQVLIYLISLYSTIQAQSIADIDRYRNWAEEQYSQGNYNLAYTNYLYAYRLAARLDFVQAANLAVDISSIYHMQDDYRRGAAICHEGAALLRRARTQPDSVWFKLNSSLGEMYKKLNKPDSCYLYFSRANTILQQHPELESRIAEYVIYHYNNQGMMYIRNNAYTEGLGYLSKALSITKKQGGSKEDVAILQNNLGGLYERLGQFQKAFDLRKLALNNYSKKDEYVCKIYNGLAGDAFQIKAYDEAILYANKAMALAKAIMRATSTQATRRSVSIALNYLGKCAYAVGQFTQAETYFKKALQDSENKGNVAENYIGLARIKQSQQQIDSALVYCQQAIVASCTDFTAADIATNPTSAQALLEQGLFMALSLKATLFLERFNASKKIADLHNASITYERALTVADAMRKSYNVLETKWFFANQVRPAYLEAFETAYLLYSQTRKPADKERAFRLMERSKAATLADIARELQIKPGNVPADLLAKEQKLQRIITTEKLEGATAPSSTLIDAQIQLAQLQQKFEKEFPVYYRAKYQPQPLSIRKVQTALDSRMAYLSYLMTQDALYMAVVTHDDVTIIRKSGDLNTLTQALKTLDNALYTNPGLGKYNGTSAAITGYGWLIEPIVHFLTNRNRLLISQDSDLHRLPFDVLETGRVVDDFLFKQYAISYVPSAHSLVNRPNDVAVREKPSLLGLAPFIEPINANDPPLSLAYLPASETEVEQLPGETLLGKAATKGRFIRGYANYNILHLATHAYADNIEPARSFIAFYPNGGPDKLYAGEVYNLLLPHTRLVTLSACETGNGKLQPGEGIISLAQAFAYAGCPSVVSTLWKANDESTAYLAQQLYKHLQAGLPIDVALQRMRMDYFESDLYSKSGHPHYWANLILIGANQPVYESPWLSSSMIWSLLAFMICLIGVWVVRQRYKGRWEQTGRLQGQIGN
ncbi:CHAT domain-containing protein [Spirosoma knui]